MSYLELSKEELDAIRDEEMKGEYMDYLYSLEHEICDVDVQEMLQEMFQNFGGTFDDE